MAYKDDKLFVLGGTGENHLIDCKIDALELDEDRSLKTYPHLMRSSRSMTSASHKQSIGYPSSTKDLIVYQPSSIAQHSSVVSGKSKPDYPMDGSYLALPDDFFGQFR